MMFERLVVRDCAAYTANLRIPRLVKFAGFELDFDELAALLVRNGGFFWVRFFTVWKGAWRKRKETDEMIVA